MPTSTPAKAIITSDELGTDWKLECVFNPKEMTWAKTVNMSQQNNQSKNMPAMQFSGGNPATLAMQLFFDCYEPVTTTGGGQITDVRDFTGKLEQLTLVRDQSVGTNTARASGSNRPPTCMFAWGTNYHFQAHVKSLTIKYILFRVTGEPVRATADVVFEQVIDDTRIQGQNPTSGSGPGYKRREVVQGDNIAMIAYQEYGSATNWRPIADANQLENPADLRPGQILAIPPLV